MHWPLSKMKPHECRQLIDTPNSVNVWLRPQNQELPGAGQEPCQSKNAPLFDFLIFLWYGELVQECKPWSSKYVPKVLPKEEEDYEGQVADGNGPTRRGQHFIVITQDPPSHTHQQCCNRCRLGIEE
jgi:hypothetical protein